MTFLFTKPSSGSHPFEVLPTLHCLATSALLHYFSASIPSSPLLAHSAATSLASLLFFGPISMLSLQGLSASHFLFLDCSPQMSICLLSPPQIFTQGSLFSVRPTQVIISKTVLCPLILDTPLLPFPS